MIRIVARTNRVGVDRDVRILADALGEVLAAPAFSFYRSIGPLHALFSRPDPEQTVLFLERITARWLRMAGRYVLIPNQERFPRRHVRLLRRMDHVLCKTRHAHEIFAALHPSVHHVGFTSIDRRLSEVAPDYDRFFHLAGSSGAKGTPALLELWRRHPGWPLLTVVKHAHTGVPRDVPANVRLITDYLPDDELRALQNACGVHLCPSTSEGWGHHIVEAMSCAAVTLVTDAPPMNELVNAERGVVVGYERMQPRKLGFDYFVAGAQLEAAITSLISRSAPEKRALGEAARRWFQANDRAFRVRLREIAPELLGPPRRTRR
jgi:glycosyltransferase involved in cell wall biosynthesis